ncbi:MAG TPA: DeoR/GlpR family DNA-binding transcription regulator [Anaerolineae bacterium]
MAHIAAIKELYLEERRQEILRQVQKAGRVSVYDLSQQFGVSEVTIRADLQSLADSNLLVRTHGGAVPAGRGLPELSLSLRRQQQVSEKNRIGEAGANLVADGDAIFLDTSSTALAIAQRLKHLRHLTIITNSLAITQEMLDAPGVTVVMPGGLLRRETVSLVGADGLEMLRKFNIQKGFFGAHGLSIPEGLTDVSAAEADVKRPLVAMCRHVIAVIDATKWGRVGLASFAPLSEIDTVITDSLAPAARIDDVRGRGIQVITV